MASLIGRFRAVLIKSSTPGQVGNKAKSYLAFPIMPVALSNTLIHNAYVRHYTDLVGLDDEQRTESRKPACSPA